MVVTWSLREGDVKHAAIEFIFLILYPLLYQSHFESIDALV